MSEIKIINNLFSEAEISQIKPKLKHDNIINGHLGRLQYNPANLPFEIISKLENFVNSSFQTKLTLSSVTCVEYSNKYGEPNLPIHWDHDNTDIIINYQFESNTSWKIALDYDLYELEDNSALIFNPNTLLHWRPHKIFKDDEFVKMIFFRFINLQNPSDYSHLDYTTGHEIFKEIEEFRSSLGT